MARTLSLTSLAAIALVAAAVSVPALADPSAQESNTTGTLIPAEQTKPRELDALIVTGATEAGDTQHYAAKSDVPQIADSDWVPADAPAL
jgi:hypothetical protein